MQTGVQTLGTLDLHESTVSVEGNRFLLTGFQSGGGWEHWCSHPFIREGSEETKGMLCSMPAGKQTLFNRLRIPVVPAWPVRVSSGIKWKGLKCRRNNCTRPTPWLPFKARHFLWEGRRRDGREGMLEKQSKQEVSSPQCSCGSAAGPRPGCHLSTWRWLLCSLQLFCCSLNR